MTDYISHLSTIVQVEADERGKPKPNEAVLAACALFKAETWQQAVDGTRQFVVMSEPGED